MAKRKKDLKKTICVTVEPAQNILLGALADYVGMNVSELLRELIPTVEEFRAFSSLQDYIDEKHPEDVIKILTKTKRMFVEILMSSHLISPIGMQCAAVSYFDKTGDEVMKLFQNFIKALQGIDYRYKITRVNFPMGRKEYRCNIVTSPKENKEEVLKLIGKYSITENSRIVKERIKTNSTLKVTKRTKKTKKTVKPKKTKK